MSITIAVIIFLIIVIIIASIFFVPLLTRESKKSNFCGYSQRYDLDGPPGRGRAVNYKDYWDQGPASYPKEYHAVTANSLLHMMELS